MADDDDLDLDGYGIANDCDDNDPFINPGISEITGNGIDENCNGMADDTAADTTPPTISAITPADGSTVKARWCTIRVEASDDIIIEKIEIYIDGGLAQVNTGSIAEMQWDLKPVPVGPHTISVKAYDGAGNIGARSIAVLK